MSINGAHRHSSDDDQGQLFHGMGPRRQGAPELTEFFGTND